MYDYNVGIFGNATITVIADNKEESERILRDTIESINLKNLKEKETLRDDVSIKKSNVTIDMRELDKNKNREER